MHSQGLTFDLCCVGRATDQSYSTNVTIIVTMTSLPVLAAGVQSHCKPQLSGRSSVSFSSYFLFLPSQLTDESVLSK